MNCQEAQKLLDAYVDGELGVVATLEIEEHIQGCRVCSHVCQNHRTLRTAVISASLYYDPPVNLWRRVRSALVRSEGVGLFPRVSTWGWVRAGIAMAVVALVGFGLVSILTSPAAENQLSQEIVASHVRSLMADHLVDVPSSDQHTVKPWFSGRLDFSPQVMDLAQQGFTLVGGRLDYVGNKPVAALVYARRKHFINVFVWPSTAELNVAEKTWTRQGYNILRWTMSGMTYWTVSDITMTELEEFARAVQNPS